MDVNYYLHREQIERVRANLADSAEARAIHRELAELYRAHVDAYRTGPAIAREAMLTATPIA